MCICCFSVISFGWVKEPALDYFNSWIMWQTNLLARSLNKIYALRTLVFFPSLFRFVVANKIESEQQIEIILLLFFLSLSATRMNPLLMRLNDLIRCYMFVIHPNQWFHRFYLEKMFQFKYEYWDTNDKGW